MTDWKLRHVAAIASPNEVEAVLVNLLSCIEATATRFGQDYVLREGVANLITGTRTLLNGQWGDRLDMGEVDGLLVTYAERIGFCLDHEAFDGDCLKEGK